MAVKIVNAEQLDSGLTSVADAIRNKGGTDSPLLFPDEFVSAVLSIETGGAGSFSVDAGTSFQYRAEVSTLSISVTAEETENA